nr:DNA/RNA non-specific endonuclease [Moraxella caviae]
MVLRCYSGVSRTPLWAAEHLTRERVTLAASLVREDSFRVESRLPHADRAELRDYSRSGYDRGHLAPNGDMASTSQQYDSFSLATSPHKTPRTTAIYGDTLKAQHVSLPENMAMLCGYRRGISWRKCAADWRASACANAFLQGGVYPQRGVRLACIFRQTPKTRAMKSSV